MKDLIKQILKEETSGLTDAQIKAGYKLMNMITKGYYWYHDTPEEPFEHTEGSIWLIKPETEKWLIQLEGFGFLWYYRQFREIFQKYLNIGHSDFELFIKIWVEDVLERGVGSISMNHLSNPVYTKDVLKKGKQLK